MNACVGAQRSWSRAGHQDGTSKFSKRVIGAATKLSWDVCERFLSSSEKIRSWTALVEPMTNGEPEIVGDDGGMARGYPTRDGGRAFVVRAVRVAPRCTRRWRAPAGRRRGKAQNRYGALVRRRGPMCRHVSHGPQDRPVSQPASRQLGGGAGATELSMDSGCNSERKEDTHRESDNEPHYHSVPAPGQVLPGRGFRDHSHQTICARLLKRALQAWEQEVRRSPVEGMSRMLTCDGWIDDVVCPA